MFWKRLAYYLNPLTMFQKHEGENKPNFSLKAMHGMNRISVMVFLFCLGILFYKYFIR